MISGSRTAYSGAYVAPETLRQIERGESQASVLDLLGPPTSRARLGAEEERWSWRWSKIKRTRETVLLLSSLARDIEESGAAFVEFREGVVTETWRE